MPHRQKMITAGHGYSDVLPEDVGKMDFNDRYANLWELVENMYRAPKRHDQRCTSRRDDWLDLFAAVRVFPRGRIGHELKNIVVEEWRRWTGKCPKDDESKESGV